MRKPMTHFLAQTKGMHIKEETSVVVAQESHDDAPDDNDMDTVRVVETILLAEKESENNVRTDDQKKIVRKANKNLAILSVSFLLLFAAFHSLQNLQSSINVVDGLGNVGLTVLYVAFLVSCVFLPPFILSKFGMKKTLIISMFGYVIYTLASFYASWWTIIPASIVLGVSGSTLWTGQMSFVTELSRLHSNVSGTKLKHSSTRFFGIFYAVYYLGNIWGNLVSSLVFSYHRKKNVTDEHARCGTAFCPRKEFNNTNLLVTDQSKIFTYSGICLGFGLLAIVLMTVFLDNLKSTCTRQSRPSSWKLFTGTLRHFWRSGYQKLLVTVTIYRGLSPSFLIGDFNAAFTSCYLGVHNVGYIMICYGISSSVSSYILGLVARCMGYHVPFITAFILQIGTGITLFLWTPGIDTPYLFYVFVCLWSVGNSAYSSVLAPLYSNLFPESTDAAMSCFNLLNSIGWVISFGLSSFVCTYAKLVLILVALFISTVCVTVVILHHKWCSNRSSKSRLKHSDS